MSHSKTWRRVRFRAARSGRTALAGPVRWIAVIVLVYAAGTLIVRALVPPPAAVGLAGGQYTSGTVRFLHDDSWVDAQGERQLQQQIFDTVLRQIAQAERLILLDMFLFNAWQGPVPETHRALAEELTNALIARRREQPDLHLLLISDPINTVYGGLPSRHFDRLRQAGVAVVLTDLPRLQDSNPAWSGLWRLFVQPFGNSPGQLLPNPFGEGRVSLRSYLALLNFKANHRKLLVTDQAGGELQALITSANPHDGSSAHRNVALLFSGESVADLIAAERELLVMNAATEPLQRLDEVLTGIGIRDRVADADREPPKTRPVTGKPVVQVLGESRIRQAVLQLLAQARDGDTVNLLMFYLSDRAIIRELKSAVARGVQVRVLLDVNQDAFGRRKNGVPNRPVAAELQASGVDVRWCVTSGEQCHAKWLHVTSGAGEHVFLLGSANFTRRNLQDLNMETNVLVRTVRDSPLARQMIEFFQRQWTNEDGRTYSSEYAAFADERWWLTLQYRFMEWSGLSTF